MVRVSTLVAVTLVGSLQVGSALAGGGGGGSRQDCVMGDWTPYEPCSSTGWKTRTRMVVVQPSRGGSPCPATMEQAKCSKKDCWTSPWGSWTCNALTGMKSRSRTITNRGDTKVKCPLTETAVCDPIPCVINTEAEDGGNFGVCELKKGAWIKTKVLGIKAPAMYGGLCPSNKDPSRTVKATCPPENCVIQDEAAARADATGWSDCVNKGSGLGWYKTKVLAIVSNEKYGGTCARKSAASRTIEALCAPVPCEYQTADEARADSSRSFTACDKVEGVWIRTKEQLVTAAAKYDGSCPAEKDRTVVETCDGVPCEYQTADEARADSSRSFTACDKVEGVWIRTKEQLVTAAAKYDGSCPAEKDRTVVETCDGIPCEVELEADARSDEAGWEDCEPTTNGWVSYKVLQVLEDAIYDGTCPTEAQRTISTPCPAVNCVPYTIANDPGPWSNCNEVGDSSWFKTKTLGISVMAMYGGTPCPSLDSRRVNDYCSISEGLAQVNPTSSTGIKPPGTIKIQIKTPNGNPIEAWEAGSSTKKFGPLVYSAAAPTTLVFTGAPCSPGRTRKLTVTLQFGTTVRLGYASPVAGTNCDFTATLAFPAKELAPVS